MKNKFFQFKNFSFIALFSVSIISGCAVEAAKDNAPNGASPVKTENAALAAPNKEASKATIKIEPNSPSDTVRVFYKDLRERKFREALFLTNLRPAIEGLTDAELKELQVDFEALAAQIPAEVEINGEITSGDKATVTAKLPDVDTEKIGIQEIKLRRENNVWIILTVDEAVEKEVRQEGRNYFFALRLKTHHEEAKAMLERVHKAQMVHAVQNRGLFGSMPELVERGFLPKDISSSATTGYNYEIQISDDRRKYTAIATPAVYGKTGKLTYQFAADGNKVSSLKSQDNKGKAFKM